MHSSNAGHRTNGDHGLSGRRSKGVDEPTWTAFGPEAERRRRARVADLRVGEEGESDEPAIEGLRVGDAGESESTAEGDGRQLPEPEAFG